MAPEFLYRGKGGAYIHDLINGWTETPPPTEFNLTGFDRFPGLFGYLKRFAAEDKFKDWLFVFGTRTSKEAACKGGHAGGAGGSASTQNGSPRMNVQLDDGSHGDPVRIDRGPPCTNQLCSRIANCTDPLCSKTANM